MAEAEETQRERLAALQAREMNLELDVIEQLLDALGDPHAELDAIHVAGTNGKGAVTGYLTNILLEGDHSVGTFTSPHIHQVNERIRIDGEDIGDKQLEDLIMRVLDAADEAGLEPTYFETLAAMAFLHFAEEDTDLAVIEVGLGGRYDATNVLVDPLLTIITNIGLEHAQQLGDTDEAIAREKAGILRKGVPVLTGAEGLALKAIWSEAAKQRAPLKVLRSMGRPEVLENTLDGITFKIPATGLGEITSRMPCTHNADNAALAVHSARLLREQEIEIPDEAILAGIEGTFLPARCQVLQKGPAFIVDGAHNPDAVKALRSFAQEQGFERLFIMYGVLKDKDYGTMTEILAPESQEVFVTKPPGSGDRGLNAKALAGEAKRYCSRVREVRNIKTALKTMLGTANPEDAILVFGSFYLAGEVLNLSKDLIRA